MRAIGKTHPGLVRANNEDAFFISMEPLGSMPNALVVSDGMGGHKAGEVASKKAIEFFCEYARNNQCDRNDMLDYIVSAVNFANYKIHELSLKNHAYYGMGATFTACTEEDGKLYIAHVGDSRLYYIQDGVLMQVTIDHSYVNELLRNGQISQEEAERHPNKNMLTRVLGVESNVEIDGTLLETADRGIILLCSDGLSNMLSKVELLKIICDNKNLESKVEKLISSANKRGGLDNISVILADMAVRA